MKTKNSKLTIRAILIIAAVILLMAVLMVVSYLKERIPSNPAGTVGNTAGNLNNSGLFCEHNGTVYFSNPYDNGSLYAMDPSEGNIRRINSSKVCNILAGGNYLYYFQMGASGEAGFGNVRTPKSFNRCDLKGKHSTSLTRDVVVTGQLVDNYLYLLTAGDDHPLFYKMKIDKSDQTDLAEYIINPACAVNGTIYYNGTQNDHYLYALDTATDVSSEVWRGNIWYPVVEGDYVYYMDVSENYRLCRYSFSQNVVEVLTNDRVDCFNVGYGYIYYQKNDAKAPQLICMRTDGSDKRVISEGIYTNINLTSQYVYFQEFGNEDASLFHSYLGSDYAESFYGAIEAAQAK